MLIKLTYKYARSNRTIVRSTNPAESSDGLTYSSEDLEKDLACMKEYNAKYNTSRGNPTIEEHRITSETQVTASPE